MLSPNTLLNKARYRVEGLYLGGQQWNVYSAVDQSIGASVLVVEYLSEDATPATEHEGLVKFADRFVMNGRRYAATEPVELRNAVISLSRAWNDFSIVVMALNSICAVANRRFEIGPQTIVAIASGASKFLPIESGANRIEIEAWHVPIEKIWSELDHISQKAIYNSWDESAIADLEQPLDESSDLYSLAAIFYRQLTGTVPSSAFERTVVGLDQNDPLVAPHTLAPQLTGEASSFLLRCLELRREKRFASFEQAIMNLPTIELPKADVSAEDHDLLDLGVPVKPAVATANVVAKVEVVPTVRYETPAADPVEESYLLEPVIEEKPEPRRDIVEEQQPIFAIAESSPKRGLGLKLAIACVVLAAVCGIGWGAYQFSQSAGVAGAPAVSAQVAAPVQRTEPIAVPSPLPNEDPAFSAVKASSDVPVDSQPNSAKADDAHPKQPAAVAKATPKPASTPDAKAKKKVTVDDLINDN